MAEPDQQQFNKGTDHRATEEKPEEGHVPPSSAATRKDKDGDSKEESPTASGDDRTKSRRSSEYDQSRVVDSTGDTECNDVTGFADDDVRAPSRPGSDGESCDAGGRESQCSRRGSPSSRLSEFSLSDSEYMRLILNDSLQLLQDLARWRKIYNLDDDIIAENAGKLLAGDFHHLYSDLPPSQQATVQVGLERMRQMPEAELLKSLDTFPVRTSGVA